MRFEADSLEMTTPSTLTNSGLLAHNRLRAEQPDHRAFSVAQPFPHAVIDEVLSPDARDIAASFPEGDWDGWRRYRDAYAPGKLICSDLTTMPPLLAALVTELCQPSFLSYLEDLTGIAHLLPDPYLEGGGLHASVAGSTLTPHTDFHIYTRLNLYRRVNVLLYLNPEWKPEWGGALELFGAETSVPLRSIEPQWGRMVIFRTDDDSPHGFTRPIAAGAYRRSVALYYYTAQEAAGYSGDTNTYWKTHGDTSTFSRRARIAGYRTLLTASRGFAMLANRCNPNIGARARPE